MTKYFLPLIASFVLALAMIACASKEPDYRISPQQLLTAYEANAVAADTKYRGKMVEVSGVVEENGLETMGMPFVMLATEIGMSLFGVQCIFSEKEKPTLGALSKGDEVTVTGTVDGYMGNVIVRGCSLSGQAITDPSLNIDPTIEAGARELAALINSQLTPTAEPTAAPTPLPTPTPDPTPTPVPAPTIAPTPTPSPLPTPTSEPTPTISPTPAPTVTPVPVEWVTRSDEAIFSIRIPSDWGSSIEIEALLESAQESLEGIPGAVAIFAARDPVTGSNVMALLDFQYLMTEEPRPIDLTRYTEMQLSDLGDTKILSTSGINIGDLNGTQIRMESTEGMLQIMALLLGDAPKMGCGSLGVILTGTIVVKAQTFDVEKVMNSFEVLPSAALVDSCDDRKALSLLEVVGPTDEATLEYNKGLELNKRGLPEQAIKEYDKAIQLYSEYVLAYNNRGNSYIELGQFERGIQDLDKAIELDPNLAMAYYNRGRAKLNMGQYQLAVPDFDKSIELEPYDAIAYNNRGLAYQELGQLQRSKEDLDTAIELDPNLVFSILI